MEVQYGIGVLVLCDWAHTKKGLLPGHTTAKTMASSQCDKRRAQGPHNAGIS
eukprot:SAG31_NODE_2456_length_5663_cov_8.660361_7_plen_52_part_00